jgi:hypothetical protein
MNSFAGPRSMLSACVFCIYVLDVIYLHSFTVWVGKGREGRREEEELSIHAIPSVLW